MPIERKEGKGAPWWCLMCIAWVPIGVGSIHSFDWVWFLHKIKTPKFPNIHLYTNTILTTRWHIVKHCIPMCNCSSTAPPTTYSKPIILNATKNLYTTKLQSNPKRRPPIPQTPSLLSLKDYGFQTPRSNHGFRVPISYPSSTRRLADGFQPFEPLNPWLATTPNRNRETKPKPDSKALTYSLTNGPCNQIRANSSIVITISTTTHQWESKKKKKKKRKENCSHTRCDLDSSPSSWLSHTYVHSNNNNNKRLLLHSHYYSSNLKTTTTAHTKLGIFIRGSRRHDTYTKHHHGFWTLKP